MLDLCWCDCLVICVGCGIVMLLNYVASVCRRYWFAGVLSLVSVWVYGVYVHSGIGAGFWLRGCSLIVCCRVDA